MRIALWKSSRVAGNCWKSLLKGQYEAEVKTFDDMEKKMTLERYQREVRFARAYAAGTTVC